VSVCRSLLLWTFWSTSTSLHSCTEHPRNEMKQADLQANQSQMFL